MPDNDESTSPFEKFYSELTTFEKLIWGSVIGAYLAALIISITYLVSSVISRQIGTAGSWAAIVSGLATVGLVVVTGLYVVYTRNLVGVMEETQREEREFRVEKQQRDLDSLRRALLQEILSIEDLHEISRSYAPGYSAYRELVPSTVYQANASEIGLLKQDEVEAVVDYYSLASMVNDLLALQRELDTPIGWGIFEQVYRTISLNWLAERKDRKVRTETTAEKIGELAEAQAEAAGQLEDNLGRDD